MSSFPTVYLPSNLCRSDKDTQYNNIISLVTEASTMPWPEHPMYLQPNRNDTWNDFQKLHRGKIVTTGAWKAAREELRQEFREYLARGGKAQVHPADREEMERFVCTS